MLAYSIHQAVVTPYVSQESGREIQEFVTMEKLADVAEWVKTARKQYGRVSPKAPRIPAIPATKVPATPFFFRDEAGNNRRSFTFKSYNPKSADNTLNRNRGDEVKYASAPFFLQTGDPTNTRTIKLDVSQLHAGTVFSVVLSNRRYSDLRGRRDGTIVIRNGVTGTAAKKLADGPIKWFYHGKPLNVGHLVIAITVTDTQFTIAYETPEGFVVHGDCPISYLTPAEIGDVRGMPFYLNIYVKTKAGEGGELK
ncbi:hypothetical protein HK104_006959, partial [Borealophlyctis nickersoniae]